MHVFVYAKNLQDTSALQMFWKQFKDPEPDT